MLMRLNVLRNVGCVTFRLGIVSVIRGLGGSVW